jgi:hypothetical protein
MKLDENCEQCGARLTVSRWQLARHFLKFPFYLAAGFFGVWHTSGPALKLTCPRCAHTQVVSSRGI